MSPGIGSIRNISKTAMVRQLGEEVLKKNTSVAHLGCLFSFHLAKISREFLFCELGCKKETFTSEWNLKSYKGKHTIVFFLGKLGRKFVQPLSSCIGRIFDPASGAS